MPCPGKKRLGGTVLYRVFWCFNMSFALQQNTDERLETIVLDAGILNKHICQFCERPLPWYRRALGQIHCSEACQTSERFQLGKLADAIHQH